MQPSGMLIWNCLRVVGVPPISVPLNQLKQLDGTKSEDSCLFAVFPMRRPSVLTALLAAHLSPMGHLALRSLFGCEENPRTLGPCKSNIWSSAGVRLVLRSKISWTF